MWSTIGVSLAIKIGFEAFEAFLAGAHFMDEHFRTAPLAENILPNADELPTYKRYPGNQPSTTFVLDELTPYTLGALVAMYEHKVFVQSVIWDINPFDQWGVELGKKLAGRSLELLKQGEGADLSGVDGSTAGLLGRIQEVGLF